MLHNHQRADWAGNKLNPILVEGLHDLLAAEQALLKVIPLYAKAADSQELTSTFDLYAAQTDEHIGRLKEAFKLFGTKYERGFTNTQQFIVEARSALKDVKPYAAERDLVLTTIAKKIVQRQMENYKKLHATAWDCGFVSICDLLENIANQEDERLRVLARLESVFRDGILSDFQSSPN